MNKKRGLKTLLVSCLLALPFSTTALAQEEINLNQEEIEETERQLSESGDKSLKKLTQKEIENLLANDLYTLPSNVFTTKPSCSAPYSTGKLKPETLEIALDYLNAMRRLGGLAPVSLNQEWSEEAQYGAVLLASSQFSHYPPQPDDMERDFYIKGYLATAQSNIAAGGNLIESIDLWMQDSDSSNIANVGHRRWQLNPKLSQVGIGFASSRSVLRVSGNHDTNCNYDFISWPASGNFPTSLMWYGMTAWSVTVNPSQYQTPNLSEIKVKLTSKKTNTSWIFDKNSTGNSYFNVSTKGNGVPNCIIFRPDVSSYEGAYTVTITGLKTFEGEETSLSYEVEFFDLPSTKDNFSDWNEEEDDKPSSDDKFSDSNKDDKPSLQEPTSVKGKKPLYRLYNSSTGEHLYTQNLEERNRLLAQREWKDEGQGWSTPEESDYPIYRLLNPNNSDHHYTTDYNEYLTLQTLGWRGEGIGLYSTSSTDANRVELYRLYNPNATGVGSHHYTADKAERDALVRFGWKDEGIAWYGLKD
ncbi:MAG: hypothetical protein K2H85_09390 [Allobaculum sp.]|nr:hypothetical protein [Allobaculum sp.]